MCRGGCKQGFCLSVYQSLFQQHTILVYNLFLAIFVIMKWTKTRAFWVFFAVGLFTVGHLYLFHRHNEWLITSDGLSYYAYLRSAIMDRDLDFSNEYEEHNPLHHSILGSTTLTVTGHRPNRFAVGSAILWLPFFLIAHFLTLLTGGVADGYSFFYQWGVGIGSLFYGFLGLWFSYRIGNKLLNPRSTLVGIWSIWLGSSLFYYAVGEPAMSHLNSFFAAALFLFSYLHVEENRESYIRWGLTGAALGLATLVRWQNILYALIPICDELWRIYQTPTSGRSASAKSAIRGLITMGIASCVVFSPQMAVWRIIYGNWLTLPQGKAFMLWWTPSIWKVLFSPKNGLFYSTPLLLLAVTGMFAMVLQRKKSSFSFLLLFLVYLYINACVVYWWGGHSFGARRFIALSPLFIYGMAEIDYILSKKNFFVRTVFILFLVIMVIWNIFITLMYYEGAIKHGGPLTF